MIQDYQTVQKNVDTAITDFKRIKCYKLHASLEEIKLYAKLAYEKHVSPEYIISQANTIFELYSRAHRGDRNQLVRFALMMTDMFHVLENYYEAGNFFLDIAHRRVNDIVKPLFFE